MAHKLLRSVRDDADIEELREAYRELVETLDSLLMGRLDHANLATGSIALGNRLGYVGNLDAVELHVITPSAAHTEFIIPHELGRIPSNYIVGANANGGVIYDGRLVPWDESNLYLKCTTANNNVILWVY